MGRKRIDPDEVVKTIAINLKLKTIKAIEKDGKPKNVIEELVKEKYEK